MKLLGKKASFIPTSLMDKTGNGGSIKEYATTTTGIITYVHRTHEWFCVSFKAGGTIQRECFKFCDIDEVVTVHAN